MSPLTISFLRAVIQGCNVTALVPTIIVAAIALATVSQTAPAGSVAMNVTDLAARTADDCTRPNIMCIRATRRITVTGDGISHSEIVGRDEIVYHLSAGGAHGSAHGCVTPDSGVSTAWWHMGTWGDHKTFDGTGSANHRLGGYFSPNSRGTGTLHGKTFVTTDADLILYCT